jgi:hypothetical protein
VAKSQGGGGRFIDALPEDGERRLMLAVLMDAIRALTIHRPAVPQLRAYRAWSRDRAWLQADDHVRPFSFINICAALGLDPGYIRRRVLLPAGAKHPAGLRRYAAKAEESWFRLQRERSNGRGHVTISKHLDKKTPRGARAAV